MRILKRLLCLVALAGGALLPLAAPAHALWPQNCTTLAAQYIGVTSLNPVLADGVSVRIVNRPPANQTWPTGYCAGNPAAGPNSTAWPMMTGVPAGHVSGDGHYAYMQVEPIWDINHADPYLSLQWTADFWGSCGSACTIVSAYNYNIHPPVGVAWRYEIAPHPDGFLWMSVYDQNNVQVWTVGTFMKYQSFVSVKVAVEAEINYNEAGFMGGHGGPDGEFLDWQYHTPAYGGVWTGAPMNPADLSFAAPPANHPYIWRWPNNTKCQLAGERCGFSFGEG